MTHEFVAAVTGAGVMVAVGLVVIVRSWAPAPARPAIPRRLLSEPVPAARPVVDPDADTQAFGIVRTGFGWCDWCGHTTSGVISRNGFRCDNYPLHPWAVTA